MQALLSLLLPLLLLPMFQLVDLHDLGLPGLPHAAGAMGQSHGCDSDNLPRPRCKVNPVGVYCPLLPAPPHVCGRLLG